jgi:chaperonin GroEL
MLRQNKEAKSSILKGINRVAEPVMKTAGAEGRFALIENQMGLAPHPTKDGVTVLNSVFGENQFEELGAQMLKQATNTTADLVGDGSTLCTILAHAITNKVLTLNNKVSHIDVKNGILKATTEVKEWLDFLKAEVDNDAMVDIATISANGDRHLGQLIAEIYQKVGVDSTVDIIESAKDEDYVKYLEGIKSDRGYAMPHFCTDFNKGIAELSDAYVLIYNDKINAVTEITEIIRKCMTEKKALLIIADDVSESAMASLISIKRDSTIPICVSVSPEHGDKRTEVLTDIAEAVGASVYNSKYNTNIVLGKAEKVIAFRDKTVIVPDYTVNQDKIDARIEFIKGKLEEADKLDEAFLKKRVANLKSAVAELYIGGMTEIEVKEKRDRVDDAVPALRSALESGYVSGGGSTLYYISTLMKTKSANKGENIGYNIIKNAIKRPLKVILDNASIKTGYFRQINLNRLDVYGVGVDVNNRKLVNMFEAGIIDSVKVIDTALDNAVSVSLITLNTDVLILSKNLQ